MIISDIERDIHLLAFMTQEEASKVLTESGFPEHRFEVTPQGLSVTVDTYTPLPRGGWKHSQVTLRAA